MFAQVDWELLAFLAMTFEIEVRAKELILISRSRFTVPINGFHPWVLMIRIDPSRSDALARLYEAAACCLLSTQRS